MLTLRESAVRYPPPRPLHTSQSLRSALATAAAAAAASRAARERAAAPRALLMASSAAGEGCCACFLRCVAS